MSEFYSTSRRPMGSYPAPQTIVETAHSYSVRPERGLTGGVACAMQWQLQAGGEPQFGYRATDDEIIGQHKTHYSPPLELLSNTLLPQETASPRPPPERAHFGHSGASCLTTGHGGTLQPTFDTSPKGRVHYHGAAPYASQLAVGDGGVYAAAAVSPTARKDYGRPQHTSTIDSHDALIMANEGVSVIEPQRMRLFPDILNQNQLQHSATGITTAHDEQRPQLRGANRHHEGNITQGEYGLMTQFDERVRAHGKGLVGAEQAKNFGSVLQRSPNGYAPAGDFLYVKSSHPGKSSQASLINTDEGILSEPAAAIGSWHNQSDSLSSLHYSPQRSGGGNSSGPNSPSASAYYNNYSNTNVSSPTAQQSWRTPPQSSYFQQQAAQQLQTSQQYSSPYGRQSQDGPYTSSSGNGLQSGQWTGSGGGASPLRGASSSYSMVSGVPLNNGGFGSTRSHQHKRVGHQSTLSQLQGGVCAPEIVMRKSTANSHWTTTHDSAYQ